MNGLYITIIVIIIIWVTLIVREKNLKKKIMAVTRQKLCDLDIRSVHAYSPSGRIKFSEYVKNAGKKFVNPGNFLLVVKYIHPDRYIHPDGTKVYMIGNLDNKPTVSIRNTQTYCGELKFELRKDGKTHFISGSERDSIKKVIEFIK